MTQMRITDLMSHFRKGISRPNRYGLMFNLPSGIGLGGASLGANPEALAGNIRTMENYLNGSGGVDVKCHTATFPQRSTLTMEQRQNSAPFKTPYSGSYDPVSFSFYNDSAMDARDYFDIWHSCVVNVGSNTMNFYDEYVSDVHMFMIDDYGQKTYGVTLFEAYPLVVGQFDVSYAQMNSVTSTTVTLAFKSWAPNNNYQSNRSA